MVVPVQEGSMSHPVPHDEGPYQAEDQEDSFEQQLVDEERRRWEERNRLVEWYRDFCKESSLIVRRNRERWNQWQRNIKENQ